LPNLPAPHRRLRGSALKDVFNPLNAELNPICHLLALLGSATIVVVSRLRVNTWSNMLQYKTKDWRVKKLLKIQLISSGTTFGVPSQFLCYFYVNI
jgi:hypothetical protein